MRLLSPSNTRRTFFWLFFTAKVQVLWTFESGKKRKSAEQCGKKMREKFVPISAKNLKSLLCRYECESICICLHNVASCIFIFIRRGTETLFGKNPTCTTLISETRAHQRNEVQKCECSLVIFIFKFVTISDDFHVFLFVCTFSQLLSIYVSVSL